MIERGLIAASALNREGIPGLAIAKLLLRFYHFRESEDAGTNRAMPNEPRPSRNFQVSLSRAAQIWLAELRLLEELHGDRARRSVAVPGGGGSGDEYQRNQVHQDAQADQRSCEERKQHE